MFSELREVAELQLQYSSSNTEAMKRRGELIRHAIPDILSGYESEFRASLGAFGSDMKIGASDGIGRKTEAPWVRIYSERMSPSARDGYYVVMHFSIDGQRMYVTIGCGSTIWANGDLTALSDEELKRRTQWARQQLLDARPGLAEFPDQIVLGAKAPLPQTFEKATVCAKQLDPRNVEREEVIKYLIAALRLLALVYERQSMGSDLSPAQVAERELEQISRPTSSTGTLGQGYTLTGPERKAVEVRAMAVAEQYLRSHGYTLTDTSASHPYDFLAEKGPTKLMIEVKGTTSTQCDAIMMTKNEVDLHRREKGSTGLIIVHSMLLEQRDAIPRAVGGTLVAHVPWDVDEWTLTPMSYRVATGR